MGISTINGTFLPAPKNHWIHKPLWELKNDGRHIKCQCAHILNPPLTIEQFREKLGISRLDWNRTVFGNDYRPITMDSELEEGYDGDPSDQFGSDDVNG